MGWNSARRAIGIGFAMLAASVAFGAQGRGGGPAPGPNLSAPGAAPPKAAPLPAWAYQVLWVNRRIGIVDPTAPVPARMSPLNAPDSPTWPDCQLRVTKAAH